MQNPITNLERNNYNINYKTKHTKHQKIINKELDLLLKFYYNIDTFKSIMKPAIKAQNPQFNIIITGRIIYDPMKA